MMRLFSPTYRPFIIAVLILLIGLAAMGLFMLVSKAVISRPAVVEWDQDVAQAFYDARSSLLTDLSKRITWLGGGLLWYVGLGVGFYFVVRRQWANLVAWALVMVLGKQINTWLKDWFDRPRPDFSGLAVSEDSAGYPSGHVMQSIMAYGMLAFLALDVLRTRWARLTVVNAAVLLVLLIGLSRLVLVIHFPSDVIGGCIAGGLWLAVCIGVRQWNRHIFKEEELYHDKTNRSADERR